MILVFVGFMIWVTGGFDKKGNPTGKEVKDKKDKDKHH
jgi:hypothetical protein